MVKETKLQIEITIAQYEQLSAIIHLRAKDALEQALHGEPVNLKLTSLIVLANDLGKHTEVKK